MKDFLVLSYCLIKFWDSHKLTIVWAALPLFYLSPKISKTLLPSIVLLPQPTGQIWLDLCLLREDCYYFSPNLVLNIWPSFPYMGRNTLVFCYCWWVMIKKSHFHCHHLHRTETQQDIWGIQSADNQYDELDVIYGVTLIAESVCTFP